MSFKKLDKYSYFRDIPFYLETNTESGGQRLTTHQFINNGTQTETNGINENKFSIKGYLTGNLLEARDELKKALETLESGILKTNYQETLVFVDTFSFSDNIKQIGKVEFSASFIIDKNKVSKQTEISYSIDFQDDLTENIRDNFNDRYGLDIMADIKKDVIKNIRRLNSVVDSVAEIRDDILETKSFISGTISQLKNAPLEIERIISTIAGVSKSLKNTKVSNIQHIQIDTATGFGSNEKNIMSDYFATLQLQASIKSTENIQNKTRQDIANIRDGLLETIDTLASRTQSDKVLQKLHDSKVALIQIITLKYSGLKEFSKYEVGITTNLLSVAMDKHSTLDTIDDIMRDNQIIDPIFIKNDLGLLDE